MTEPIDIPNTDLKAGILTAEKLVQGLRSIMAALVSQTCSLEAAWEEGRKVDFSQCQQGVDKAAKRSSYALSIAVDFQARRGTRTRTRTLRMLSMGAAVDCRTSRVPL